MKKMEEALKDHGIIYTSFKYGTFSGERNGRYFTDMTEEKFAKLQKQMKNLVVLEQWNTLDVRPEKQEEKWFNVLLQKRQ
jgi:hypothetical protein